MSIVSYKVNDFVLLKCCIVVDYCDVVTGSAADSDVIDESCIVSDMWIELAQVDKQCRVPEAEGLKGQAAHASVKPPRTVRTVTVKDVQHFTLDIEYCREADSGNEVASSGGVFSVKNRGVGGLRDDLTVQTAASASTVTGVVYKLKSRLRIVEPTDTIQSSSPL